jgi:hypothetical protein
VRETEEQARGAQGMRPSARSRTAERSARVARVALGYFALSTVALVAPVYTALGNAIEPRVLGIPWSLAYVLGVVLLNATVLAVLYAGRWVDSDDGDGDDDGDDDRRSRP